MTRRAAPSLVLAVAALLSAGCSGPSSAPTNPVGPPSGSAGAAGTSSASGMHPSASTVSSTPTRPQATQTATAPEGSSGPVIDLRETVHTDVAFASPSGRIVCLATNLGPGWGVRCDVEGATWTIARPSTCHGGWGDAVELDAGRAAVVCHTDTVGGSANIGQSGTWWFAMTPLGSKITHHGAVVAAIPYGTTIMLDNGISCLSTTAGMNCSSSATRHGFTASLQRVALR